MGLKHTWVEKNPVDNNPVDNNQADNNQAEQNRDEQRRPGRTAVSAFLAYRATGLATGLAAVVAARRRYRHPWLAGTQLAVASVESAWLARRLWYRGGIDTVAARIDAATTVLAIVSVRSNIAPSDRWTFVNWAPWGLGATAMTGQPMLNPNRSLGALAPAAAIATVASASLSATPGAVGTNMIAMTGFYVGGNILSRQIHKGAERLRIAQDAAVTETAALARELERGHQLRILHDSALQTLEAVASDRAGTFDRMRRRASDEAAMLQSIVDGITPSRIAIGATIRSIVEAHAQNGLTIDVHAEAVDDPPYSVGAALRDACNEALTNVGKHAHAARTSLHVSACRDGIEIVVRDDGVGFDPATTTGFGTQQSIVAAMNEVGGTATITSTPDRGTVVRLWGPA